jgi:NADPH:quinone reductase-like Zn-dependent oxidoreductase
MPTNAVQTETRTKNGKQKMAKRSKSPTHETMRRVVIHKAGGFDRLVIESAAVPEPKPGEVLIAVQAAGVNFADSMVRMGLYESAKEFVGWPITPGFEVAGTVIALGEGATKYAIGDEVVAVTLFGGYTSHLAVPEHMAFARPKGLDMNEAAALPSVFMTAWFALYELAHPRPGYRALVHSAAGGVGTMLLQLLRIRGVETVAVVGASHKVESAKKYGADHVIDKSKEDLWQAAERIAPDGYDLILDANGVATLKDSYRHLRKAGKLVVYGFHSMMSPGGKPNWIKLATGYLRTPRFNPFELTMESKSVLAFNLSYLFDRRDLLDAAMADLATWLDEGRVVAPPVTTFPLDKVADAQRAIESGQTIGKLVLVP